MANRRRDPQREQFWRDVLARFRTSGLSVRAFCRQEQLSESQFYAWRRTVAKRDGTRVPSRKRPAIRKRPPRPQPPAFLPLVMRAETAGLPGPGMSLELRGGRVLRLGDSIPIERLAALIHALEASEAAS